jgi:hypothetical protein
MPDWMPYGPGSCRYDGLTVIDIGSQADERYYAELERKEREAEVRRRWLLV